jgi:hypothetical protein
MPSNPNSKNQEARSQSRMRKIRNNECLRNTNRTWHFMFSKSHPTNISHKYLNYLTCSVFVALAFSLLLINNAWGATTVSIDVNSSQTVGTNTLSLGFVLDADWEQWYTTPALTATG